jgi:hypothetical protein
MDWRRLNLTYQGEQIIVLFVTEDTEFTDKYLSIRCFAFLGVLGDLCGKKNLMHLLIQTH